MRLNHTKNSGLITLKLFVNRAFDAGQEAVSSDLGSVWCCLNCITQTNLVNVHFCSLGKTKGTLGKTCRSRLLKMRAMFVHIKLRTQPILQMKNLYRCWAISWKCRNVFKTNFSPIGRPAFKGICSPSVWWVKLKYVFNTENTCYKFWKKLVCQFFLGGWAIFN